jgi:sulfur relay protein TusB/DsrH
MLYLLDHQFVSSALPLLEHDEDAVVVLIKDGVYIKLEKIKAKKIYAMKDDVEKRGLSHILEGKVEMIDYPELIDLIEANKVANFC